jgi:hypothetical protein
MLEHQQLRQIYNLKKKKSLSPQYQKGVCCCWWYVVVRAQSNDVLYTAAAEAMKRQAQI